MSQTLPQVYVTQKELLLLHPALLAAESSATRRARVALQLRDRHGRWIEMGGGVSFHMHGDGAGGSAGGTTTFHGTVVGGDNATGQVHVQLENGNVVSVPASKLEQPKAVIGLHQPAAPAPGVTTAPAPAPDHSALDALSRVGNGINPEFGRMIRAGIDQIKAGEDPAAVIQEMRDKVPNMLFARDHLRAKEALDKVEAVAIPGGTHDRVDSGSGYTSLYGDLLGTGLTPDAARQVDDTLRRLHDTYGFSPDYVGTIGQVYARYNIRDYRDTISATMGVDPETGKSFLGINAAHLNDYEKLLAENGTPGWNTVPTLDGVITHEFGHLLDFKHPPGHEDDLAYQQIADTHFSGDVNALHQALKTVSGYAGTHRNEAVAEAFAKYKHDPNSPAWLQDWGQAMDRLWSRPAHTHDEPPPPPPDQVGLSRPEVARGSQNRPVVRADDKRSTQGQTRTNFINETTGAPMGKTETGDTFERLFDDKGKALLRDRYGDFSLVTGAGGGTSRTTPLDLVTRTHGGELKTMSSKSKNLKTAVKADEVRRKLEAVGSEKLKPLTLVQVVNQDDHRVELYGMEMFGSKAVSRMEHFGGYDYTPEDFALAQRAAGHDDKAVARAFQSMTPEQKASHVAHVQNGVPPREASRLAFGQPTRFKTGASTTGPPTTPVEFRSRLDSVPADPPGIVAKSTAEDWEFGAGSFGVDEASRREAGRWVLAAGMNGPARKVSNDELNGIRDQGTTLWYRGTSDPAYNEALTSAPYYPGAGYFGEGYHFARSADYAAETADYHGSVVPMAFTPDAKLLDLQQYETDDPGNLPPIVEMADQLRAAGIQVPDGNPPSLVAAAHGYDGIIYGNEDGDAAAIVVNRAKTLIGDPANGSQAIDALVKDDQAHGVPYNDGHYPVIPSARPKTGASTTGPSLTPGQEITWTAPNMRDGGTVTARGTFLGLNPDGKARVKTEDGRRVTVKPELIHDEPAPRTEDTLSQPVAPDAGLITPSDRVWTKQELDAIPMNEPTLNRDQKEAISEYRLPDNAIAINEALRAGTPLTEITDEWSEPGETPYQDMHDQLLSVAQQSTLTAPVVSYRGMNVDTVPQAGETISQKGWSSATVNQEFARGVADLGNAEGRQGGAHPVLLEINAAPGTHVINTHSPDTGELIFPPDTPFHVDSVTTDPNGLIHVKVSVPSTTPTPPRRAPDSSKPIPDPTPAISTWWEKTAPTVFPAARGHIANAISRIKSVRVQFDSGELNAQQYQEEIASIISSLRGVVTRPPGSRYVDRLVKMLEGRGFTASAEFQNDPVVSPPGPGDLVETNESLQTPAQPDHSDGVMIALKVPDPENYALPDGADPDDLHLTLVNLGRANELSPDEKQGVLDAAQHAAARFGRPPLALFPYDYGTFDAEGQDGKPFVLHPYGQDLDELYAHVCNALKEHGLGDKISADYPFNPHVTLKYLQGDEQVPHPDYTPPDMSEVAFPQMRVSVGDDEHLVSLANHEERPIRPQQVMFSVEERIHDLVQSHNVTASRGTRASLPMLKAVYSREFQDTLPSPSQSLTAAALSRCERFLSELSRRNLRCPDADLFPPVGTPTPFSRTLTASAQLQSDRIKGLLMDSVIAGDPDLRSFNLSRALAAAASSFSPQVRLELVPAIRTLLADGNSSAARSLRAKMQLRDRHGRWIEEGKGVRFKVHLPGEPGGGTWYHGTVAGQDIPNGNVSVRLEDGRLVQVPAAKIDQPKAIIGQHGENVMPPTAPSELDANAPVVAHLPEVSSPVNAQDPVSAGEIRHVLSQVATRLHDDFRDNPDNQRRPVERLRTAVHNAVRDLANPDPKALDNAAAWIDHFLRDNPSLNRNSRDALLYAQNSYTDMAQVLRDYQHDAQAAQVQHHVQLPPEARRPFHVFRNGRAQDDLNHEVRHRSVTPAGENVDVNDLEVPQYRLPRQGGGNGRLATAGEIRNFLMQDFGVGVSFPPDAQGRPAADRLHLHGDRARVNAALQEVWGLTLDDSGRVVPRPDTQPPPTGDEGPLQSIQAAIDQLDNNGSIAAGLIANNLRMEIANLGPNPTAEQWQNLSDGLDGGRQFMALLIPGAENDEQRAQFEHARDLLDEAATNAWGQARPEGGYTVGPSPASDHIQAVRRSAEENPPTPEELMRELRGTPGSDVNAQLRAFADQLDHALDALGDMEDARVPGIDQQDIRDRINRVQDDAAMNVPSERLQQGLDEVMGQINTQLQDAGINAETDLNTDQESAYSEFRRQMQTAHDLASGEIHVPGGPGQPNADDMADNPATHDQFGGAVPDGFNFDQEVINNGTRVQLYNHTTSDGREWQVGVRPNRLGAAPMYVIRSGSMHNGARHWSVLNNQPNWDSVGSYFNQVEQDAEQRGIAQANRDRVVREQAQEAQRARADHERRVVENVDDGGQPLPPGWSRHQDEGQQTFYQDGNGNVIFQLQDGLAAYAQDPIAGGRERVGSYRDWTSALAGLDNYHRTKQVHARELVLQALDANSVNISNQERAQIQAAPDQAAIQQVLNDNSSYQAMRAAAADAEGADILNPQQRARVNRRTAINAAVRRIGPLAPDPNPSPEASLHQDEYGRDLPTGWTRATGEEHSGEPVYNGPNGATAYVDGHLTGHPIQLGYNDRNGYALMRSNLRDWGEVQQALEEALGNPRPGEDQIAAHEERAGRDEETGFRDSLYQNLIQIGVDEQVANQIMYISQASGVRDYVESLAEVRDLLAEVANERSTDVAPVDQRNARLITRGLDRVVDLPRNHGPAPDSGPVGSPGNPNDVRDSGAPPTGIPDNAPDHPDDRGVAIAPEDLPRVGAPPGFEARYHPDGVIQDRNGNEIRRDAMVRSRHNGADIIGRVVAVQQQPPYARIQWPDGRRQVRAGGRLAVVEPAQVPGFNAPAAPAPAAENPPPAPNVPAPQGNALQELQAIADMHQAGADRMWPLLTDISNARQNINSAITKAVGGDRDGAAQQLALAISNYNRGMQTEQFRGSPAEYKGDVQRRLELAVKALDNIANPAFPLTAPRPDDHVNALIAIYNQFPERAPRGRREGVQERAVRFGGLALRDAVPILQRGDVAAAEQMLNRAAFKFRQGGRQDLSDQVQQAAAGLRGGNAGAPAAAAPGPGDVPEPRDFIANRFEGDRAPRAMDPRTPGVVDPHDAPGNPPHPQAPNPAATQVTYQDWGVRANEIAQAARVRPSMDAIIDARLDPVQLQELLNSAFGGLPGTTFGNKGYTVDVRSSGGREDYLSVSLVIRDANGGRVGSATRQFTKDADGRWKAYNAGMDIPDSNNQSSGFANALNRYFENFYIANNFKQVTVSASGAADNTGGFAWAMNGFGFKHPSNEIAAILSKLKRGARDGSVEAQVIRQMEARAREGQRTGNDSLIPTPMELALVGWSPTATSWLGKRVMINHSWDGKKDLVPTNVNWQQRQNYEIAKLAAARFENRENSFNVNRPFANSIADMSAPGLREAAITPAEADLVGKLMRSTNPSAAALPFTTKKKFMRWASDQARAGNWNSDIENVAQTLRQELLADYPQQTDLGVGTELQTVSLDRLRNNSLPGWDVHALGAEPGEAHGINPTFVAVHSASGQQFFVKKDESFGRHRDEVTSTGAEAEADVNALLRAVNWPGIEGADAHHENGGTPQDQPLNMVVMHRVGDNLDLIQRPNTAGAMGSTRTNDAFRHLAQHDQLFRMIVMDGLLGNGDRHHYNYMLGEGSDGRWWLFPIDHGHVRTAHDGAERLDPIAVADNIINGYYSSNFYEALREYTQHITDENLDRLLRGILEEYRQGVSANPGIYRSQDFQRKMIENIQLMERRMAELVRLFKER